MRRFAKKIFAENVKRPHKKFSWGFDHENFFMSFPEMCATENIFE